MRKSRKLTQLLGETPSPLVVTPPALPGRVSNDEPPTGIERLCPRLNWAFRQDARSSESVDAIHSHSMLSRPMDALSISEPSLTGEEGTRIGKGKARDKIAGARDAVDSASFIDLSDDDDHSIRILSSYSFPSPPFPCSPEETRRRRREQLAKLHRFLGSRVPTSLVLGLSDADDVLPVLDHTASNLRPIYPGRRRSSSAAEFKSNWFDPNDRVKEELDEREKAINVRRAVKMEKVSCVAPHFWGALAKVGYFPRCLAYSPRKHCIIPVCLQSRKTGFPRPSIPLILGVRLCYLPVGTLIRVHIRKAAGIPDIAQEAVRNQSCHYLGLRLATRLESVRPLSTCTTGIPSTLSAALSSV